MISRSSSSLSNISWLRSSVLIATFSPVSLLVASRAVANDPLPRHRHPRQHADRYGSRLQLRVTAASGARLNLPNCGRLSGGEHAYAGSHLIPHCSHPRAAGRILGEDRDRRTYCLLLRWVTSPTQVPPTLAWRTGAGQDACHKGVSQTSLVTARTRMVDAGVRWGGERGLTILTPCPFDICREPPLTLSPHFHASRLLQA